MATVRPDYATALTPGVRKLMKQLSPPQVMDFRIMEERQYATDRIVLTLHVQHLLRDDPLRADTMHGYDPEVAKRIRLALLIKEPDAKGVRVERRLMRARAEQARKSKARRT